MLKTCLEIWEILQSGEKFPSAKQVIFLLFPLKNLLADLLQLAISFLLSNISDLKLKRISCNLYSCIKATYNC